MRSALLSTLLVALSACGGGNLCENSAHGGIPSPDGELVAWVFLRSCGPGTPTSTHVSILPTDAPPPSEAGNVFVAEPIVEVSVEWPGDHRLLVWHGANGRVLEQQYQVSGVTLAYRSR